MNLQQQKQVLTFEGIVKEIGEVKTHESKYEKGVYFAYRKIRVESEEKYPQSAWFTVRSQKLMNFPFEIGTKVRVYYNLKAYETEYGESTGITAWDMVAI